MKSFRFIPFLGILAFALAGCGGADGAVGPTGNANVKIYEFGSTTFTGTANFTVEIPRSTMDSSAMFVYYNPVGEVATAWYSAPGLGPTGAYQTRYVIHQISADPSTYQLSLRTVQANGAGPYAVQVTFTRVRLVLVKSTEVNLMTNSLTSYRALQNRFSLPE